MVVLSSQRTESGYFTLFASCSRTIVVGISIGVGVTSYTWRVDRRIPIAERIDRIESRGGHVGVDSVHRGERV